MNNPTITYRGASVLQSELKAQNADQFHQPHTVQYRGATMQSDSLPVHMEKPFTVSYRGAKTQVEL